MSLDTSDGLQTTSTIPQNSPILPEAVINLTNPNDTKSILPMEILASRLFNKTLSLGEEEVQLPISKRILYVGKISSSDDAILRSISGSLHMYTTSNAKLFYSSCTAADNKPFTFEDFLNLPEADLSTIMYAVTRCSFTTLTKKMVFCTNENCTSPLVTENKRKYYESEVKTKDLQIEFKEEYIPTTDSYLTDVYPVSKDTITINFKFERFEEMLALFQSKTNDEMRKRLTSNQDLLTTNELLPIFIKSLIITDPSSPDIKYELTDSNQIFIFISKLDITAKEVFDDLCAEGLSKIKRWNPNIVGYTVCPYCGKEHKQGGIDLMVELFLKFSALY